MPKKKLFIVETLSINNIIIQNRARQDIGDLSDLTGSIKESGQLNPILVNDKYELIAGERRIMAMKKLGRKKIIARIMPDISPDDALIIERMENLARKDFIWHEELKIRLDLHLLWKKNAEADNKTWGYRETAKQLRCSLGGLSTDLVLAAAIETFPQLKEYNTKGTAKDAYKKLGQQAAAIQSMDNLPKEEKERLAKVMSGELISKMAGKVNQKPIPKAQHDDVLPDLTDLTGGSLMNTEENDPSLEETSISVDIEPVYANESYKTFIPKLPDNIVGLIELDPPYAIDYETTAQKAVKKKIDVTDWTTKQLYEFYTDYLPLLYRKLLANSWVLCWTGKEHIEPTQTIAREAGFKTQSPGVWTKSGGGASNTPSTTMIPNYENFLLFRKGNAIFNHNYLPASITCASASSSSRIHEWEKPVEVYDIIFKQISRAGAIMLSPFAGSGNAMISAAKHDMNPMGCDDDQTYAYGFYENFKNYFI
ncbi:MAG: ParB N-terminal domain-containing protein [Planctomycetes bacterium]|nr:ParB N-terminal domain-containing protein [Planctomycetota bacterium]